MRKIIVSMMVSADGFIEDGQGSINWHVWDEEMDDYMLHFFDELDTLLLGRKTYQLMHEYWPTEQAVNENPGIAANMNGLPRIVFSTTLTEATWAGTILQKEVSGQQLQMLKEQPGKDMVIFGGAELVNSFRELNLIDEYRLILNPLALGSGKPFFKTGADPLDLTLINSQSFSCGNVLLCYEPLGKPA